MESKIFPCVRIYADADCIPATWRFTKGLTTAGALIAIPVRDKNADGIYYAIPLNGTGGFTENPVYRLAVFPHKDSEIRYPVATDSITTGCAFTADYFGGLFRAKLAEREARGNGTHWGVSVDGNIISVDIENAKQAVKIAVSLTEFPRASFRAIGALHCAGFYTLEEWRVAVAQDSTGARFSQSQIEAIRDGETRAEIDWATYQLECGCACETCRLCRE